MILSLSNAVQQTCRTILSTTCCSLVLLTATSQNVDAAPPKTALGAPDIIEISVQHLSEVQNQLSLAVGVSWGTPSITNEFVRIGDTKQLVEFTRVFSVSSYPYIELIQTSPQIDPWAPFNNANPELGDGPRTSMAWRISNSDFESVKNQMTSAGLLTVAEGLDFVYYESLEGVLLEIVRDNIAPDPADGVPNTPPPGIIDFGAMSFLSISLQNAPVTVGTSPGINIPTDDFIIRQQISAATGGGITWDINEPIATPIPYNQDGNPNPVFLGNPSLVDSCNQHPFIDLIVIYPNIAPFGASCNSTTFSQAWIVPGSGLDPAGTAVMNTYEDQLVAAGFQSVIRLDAQTLGITPYESDILRYFVGIDNVDIQVVNQDFAPTPTISCTAGCTVTSSSN